MGVGYSRNVAKSYTDVTIDIVNSYLNNCSTVINNTDDFNFTGCTGVNIDSNNFGNTIVYNGNCIQNITTNSQINDAITQAIQQMAQADTQSLGFPSGEIASNYTNAVVKLSDQVRNVYTNKCNLLVSNNVDVQCTNSSDIVFKNNSFSNTINDMTNCTQNDQTVNSLSTTVEQAISQTAVAKEQNAFGAVIIVLILLLIIPFFFVAAEAKWIILGIIFLVVFGTIVYLILAKEQGWTPFKMKSPQQ